MPPATSRVYQGLPDIDYPFHDKVMVGTRCGRICLGNKKINFSQLFAGQAVGIKEVHDDIVGGVRGCECLRILLTYADKFHTCAPYPHMVSGVPS